MRRGVWNLSVPWILAIAGIALLGCGGGGGGTAPSSSVPTATIQGSVSGTIIMAIDESGKIAAKDNTAGKTPVNGKYPFTLMVPVGHQYTIQFIVTDTMTGEEKVVPLYQGATNIFSVASSGTLDLGFVDTSGTNAASDNNILTQPGVTSGGTTPPPTITLQGYRCLYTRNGPTGVVTAKFHVEVRDPGGTTSVTDRSLIKDVAFFDSAWNSLPLSGSFTLWNGTETYFDSTGTIVPVPQADVEATLAAAPSGLAAGFYNVVVTDNAGNLHNAKVYFRQPDPVAKASNLAQGINTDNSITLTWNTPDLTGGKYMVYLLVTANDLNGDGVGDSLLVVRRSTPMNTYTIPADFVASQLAGKSGLKWHVQIRQYDDTIEYPDGTSQGIYTVFQRNYSAESTLTLPSPYVPTGFSQADLTGTWDVLQFQTGVGAGWMRAVAAFNASGNLTSVTDYLDSGGSTNPGPLAIVWTVSASGVISETDGGAPTGFHAQMSSDKKLIVGIQGWDNNLTSVLTVARKRTGAVFTSADVANISFASHGLSSGTDNTWEWSVGTTDSSGNVSVSSRTDPSGTESGPFSNVAKISISPFGIVTDAMDLSFYGFMTDDKKVFFSIDTSDSGPSGSRYSFMAIQVTGQTYTQADLAGTYYWNTINSATLVKPIWSYGSSLIGNTGNGAYLTYKDSANGAMPGPYTRDMNSAGVVTTTDLTPSMFHGQLSYNMDLLVRTGTSASGRHQLSISIK